MSSAVIFEDIFVVDRLDPDGKKFDKVTRIEARSQNLDMFMHLDMNIEIYPMREGDKFTMALAHTLNLEEHQTLAIILREGGKLLLTSMSMSCMGNYTRSLRKVQAKQLERRYMFPMMDC